jgi:hypothetical protein
MLDPTHRWPNFRVADYPGITDKQTDNFRIASDPARKRNPLVLSLAASQKGPRQNEMQPNI